MREIHTTSSEAEEVFVKKLSEVAVGDHWMAAVWQVKDGKIELVQCTTSNFPRGDYLAAIGGLAMNRFQEMKESQGLPSDPLPKAGGIFPLPFAFCGKGKDGEEGNEKEEQKKPFIPEN